MTYFLSSGYDDPEHPTYYIDWSTGKTYKVNPVTKEKTYDDNYYERNPLNRSEAEILSGFTGQPKQSSKIGKTT